MSVWLKYVLLASLAIPCWAGEPDRSDRRAWVNYALRCQGCHLPDAAGMDGKVPRLKNFVGYFLHSDEGRRFIIQVPGVAKSTLSDAELSELMNWIVYEFSPEQIPADFLPYTAAEVGRLRERTEPDPLKRRGDILANLAQSVSALSCYSDAWVTVDNCT